MRCRPLAVLLLVVSLASSIACNRGVPVPRSGLAPRSGRAPRPRGAADPGFLEQYAATFRFRLGHPKGIKLTPKGDAVLLLRSGPRSFVHDLYVVDVASGKERLLLASHKLLSGGSETLTTEERARRERQRLLTRGITSFQLSRDGNRLLVTLGGRLFLCHWREDKTTELQLPAGKSPPIDPRLSPVDDRVAYVRHGDLYVFDPRTGRQQRLTRRTGPRVSNGLAEFVAQEEMGRQRGFWWSPDGTRLAYQQTDTSAVERLHIFDPTQPERPPTRWAYPRAGRANATVRLGVIPATGGETRWLQWDRKQMPYLATVRWPRKGPLSLAVQNRTQTELTLLTADPATGITRTILTERDAAWVNLDQQMPRWLADGSGFLWTSERGGAWQLELRAPGGALLRTLTRPALGYRGLVDVDLEGKSVVLRASPKTAREVHLFRVPLDGQAAPQPLSRAPGWHDAVFSRDHSVYVHSVDPQSGPVTHRVVRRDGHTLAELRTVAERPPWAINLQLLRVGRRPLEAAVVRPRKHRPGQRLPVVVYVYGGPNYQVVTARERRYLLQQWIADHGFAVISIDGRGTPGRGRDWERAIKGNLVDIPLADQLAGLDALGKQMPELDLSRVGIYGWSFGGYMATMAVLRRPDRFRAAVAGAPVTDWLSYDTHYTERYLGLPADNAQGYRHCSALHLADQLRRPLLVIHGTADDNVYYAHSLRLSDALFRAGRPHQLLTLTNFTHLVPDPLVTRRLYGRVVAFMRQHLQH